MSWLERHRSELMFSLVNLIVVGGLVFFLRGPRPGSVQVLLPPPTSTPLPTGTPAPLRVYVSGAVAHPDVYVLSPASIVKDALAAAGGASADADLARVNLALALQDQMQVHVPMLHETLPAAAISSTLQIVTTPMGVVNINTASLADLDRLAGIGPTLAQRIIDYRPYRSIQEILNVPGIGQATFEKLKDSITVR